MKKNNKKTTESKSFPTRFATPFLSSSVFVLFIFFIFDFVIRLTHPNIVQLLETYEDKSKVYLVMELWVNFSFFDLFIIFILRISIQTNAPAQCSVRNLCVGLRNVS